MIAIGLLKPSVQTARMSAATIVAIRRGAAFSVLKSSPSL